MLMLFMLTPKAALSATRYNEHKSHVICVSTFAHVTALDDATR